LFIINNESNFQYPVASILTLLASQNDTIILERHNTYQMNNLFHEFFNSLLKLPKAVLLSILNVSKKEDSQNKKASKGQTCNM
jgi:hypothetical protein